jgi:hypothetical protein
MCHWHCTKCHPGKALKQWKIFLHDLSFTSETAPVFLLLVVIFFSDSSVGVILRLLQASEN